MRDIIMDRVNGLIRRRRRRRDPNACTVEKELEFNEHERCRDKYPVHQCALKLGHAAPHRCAICRIEFNRPS
jgi:hypothetical protein